jgi:hypothetical protein
VSVVEIQMRPSRPAIRSITVRSSATVLEATVTLTAAARPYVGRARGPAGPTHRADTIARAALAAAQELVGRSFELESAAIAYVGARPVALCLLTVPAPRDAAVGGDDQVLAGCAPVRGDEAEAVCRAVLDALNRQL